MSTTGQRVNHYLQSLLRGNTLDQLEWRLTPKHNATFSQRHSCLGISGESLERRWALLKNVAENRTLLLDSSTETLMHQYEHNVENFIGTVKVPVGIAGPLRVNGLFAQGEYYVPLATTEAALVASYSRGARLMSEVGGCTAMVLNEGISRTPGFVFRNLREVGRFVHWVIDQQDNLRVVAESTTKHGKLVDTRLTVEGNHVYLELEFTTEDASGQNMVTIATEAVCNFILKYSPISPQLSGVESNLSGDKKASARSYLSVRGKKVTAEITLPADLIVRRFRTSPQQMVNYWQLSALGGILSGTIGVQGHYANALAAVFIACGQDTACVAEAAVGITRLELTTEGALYAAVTLPNLVVGTVGGGTSLPTQQACLSLMGLSGPGQARALAEVCAGLCLAGELSINGALSQGGFTRAHRRLARGGRRADLPEGVTL